MDAIWRVRVCEKTGFCCFLAMLILCGCAGPAIETARSSFYLGRYEYAERSLRNIDKAEYDLVLLLMERGMIRQGLGEYSASSMDFIRASDLLERFETYSVSRGAASMLVNDTVKEFRGFPFERTLLHVFTAKNHLAEGHWNNAAVESRRIIRTLMEENRGEYPEDAYSRYMAGFCLEMIDDYSNASLQYRKAGALLKNIRVEEKNGRIIPAGFSVSKDGPGLVSDYDAELVCFVVSGKVPTRRDFEYRNWRVSEPVYGEIYCRGQYLGRSYVLTDSADLSFTSEQMDAARDAVKTVARVAIKEKIADSMDEQDELLGAIARLILIGLLEKPDMRRWETLPRWLGVARVNCPSDIKEFDVVFKTSSGMEAGRVHVVSPLMRRRNTFISFCRDLDSLRSEDGK